MADRFITSATTIFSVPHYSGNRCNWICQTEWISEKITPDSPLIRLKGEPIEGEIIVAWNEKYRELSKILGSSELSKEKYLDSLFDILEPVKDIVVKISDLMNKYNSGQLDESKYINLMSKFEPELTKLYFQATKVGAAPIECKDLSQQFQNLMAVSQNIVLPFSETGLKKWKKDNREYLANQGMKDYPRELLKLEFELEKVNTV